MRRGRSILLVVVVSAASLFALSFARAAPTATATCIAAFDDGQSLRSRHHLRDARDKLLVCTKQECPGMIRNDCANVLREVERALPTIVLSAVDGEGRDLTDVRVSLGGRALAEHLDGRAVTVDPGKLTLRFEHAPHPPVDMEIVVGEGEKNRAVRAVLGPRPAKRPPPPAEPVEEPRSVVGWGVPVGLAVVSAAGFVIAGTTRARLGNEADSMRDSCAPACSFEDRDRMSGDLTLANVALGVGIASLAGAVATWFIFTPRGASKASAAAGGAILRW